jgi:DHA2 family multidrug resistance protein
MEVLDTSIAAVILPHIAGSLSSTTDEATWVLTSYLVANAVILPASGWFALRYGRRNFLLFCISLFTLASFFCGAAQNLGMMLFARAIQGAGGGALQPLSQSILLESFPPQKRGQAMAAFALGVVVAPVLGPTLGGWLTDQYTWRWAFYINIPIGVLATFLIMRFVKDPPYIQNAKPGKFDGIGLGLLAVWIGTLQVILDKGQEDDWFGAAWIRWAAVVLVVGLVAFLIRELVVKNPIVNLRIFKDRNFTIGCILIGAFGAVVYGLVTLLPLFYQTLLNYTASAAGLAVSPRGIGAILVMPLIGIMTAKMDNRYLVAAGFALFGWCAWWSSNLTLDVSQWSLFWPILLSGTATGLIFVPLSTTSVATLSNEQIGNASGLYNFLRNIGASIGIAVVDTMLARRQQVHRNELSRYLAPTGLAQRTFLKLQSYLSLHTGPRLARLRAYAILQNGLEQQSILYSYVDDLRYMVLVCAICLPIVFLLRPAKAKAGATPAGH